MRGSALITRRRRSTASVPVGTPSGRPAASSTGPCSMWSSSAATTPTEALGRRSRGQDRRHARRGRPRDAARPRRAGRRPPRDRGRQWRRRNRTGSARSGSPPRRPNRRAVRVVRRYPSTTRRAQHLERGEHAKGAVERAAVGDRVEVAADHDRRGSRPGRWPTGCRPHRDRSSPRERAELLLEPLRGRDPRGVQQTRCAPRSSPVRPRARPGPRARARGAPRRGGSSWRGVAQQLVGRAVDAAAVLVDLAVGDRVHCESAGAQQLRRARALVGHSRTPGRSVSAFRAQGSRGSGQSGSIPSARRRSGNQCGRPAGSTRALSTSSIARCRSRWIEKPAIGTTSSSTPRLARISRSCSAAAALQRTEVPNAASVGVSLTKEPPSSVPEPTIVAMIGGPSRGDGARHVRLLAPAHPRCHAADHDTAGDRDQRVADIHRLGERGRQGVEHVDLDTLALEHRHEPGAGRRAGRGPGGTGPSNTSGRRVDEGANRRVPDVAAHNGEGIARRPDEDAAQRADLVVRCPSRRPTRARARRSRGNRARAQPGTAPDGSRAAAARGRADRPMWSRRIAAQAIARASVRYRGLAPPGAGAILVQAFGK